MTYLHTNQKVQLARNFNFLFQNGLLKVTDSHVNCKCSNNSKMVQDSRYYWS